MRSEKYFEEDLAAANATGSDADSASLSCRQGVLEKSSAVCELCGRPTQGKVKSGH